MSHFCPAPANTPDSNNHLIMIFSSECNLIHQLCLLRDGEQCDTNQAPRGLELSTPGLEGQYRKEVGKRRIETQVSRGNMRSSSPTRDKTRTVLNEGIKSCDDGLVVLPGRGSQRRRCSSLRIVCLSECRQCYPCPRPRLLTPSESTRQHKTRGITEYSCIIHKE